MTDKQEENTDMREMEYEELKLQVKQLENTNKNILSQLVNLEKEIKKQVENQAKQAKQTKHRFNAQFSLSVMLAIFAIIRAYAVSISVNNEHEIVQMLIIAVLVISFIAMTYFGKKIWHNAKQCKQIDKNG